MAKFKVWVQKGTPQAAETWNHGTHNLLCFEGPEVLDLKASDIRVVNGWYKLEFFLADQTPSGVPQMMVNIFPGNPGMVRLYLPEQSVLMHYKDAPPEHPPVS